MRARVLFFLALSTGALLGAAKRDAVVVRPGLCSTSAASYLLAPNGGAIIKVDEGPGGAPMAAIVFRPQPLRGWASQRLLRRFDLELEAEGVRIVNSGGFCREGK